jgi:hypothetical protein
VVTKSSGPPNFPNAVPLWWCLKRQAKVVGTYWWLCLPLVWDSAWNLKREIDAMRAETRRMLKLWDRI